MMIQLKLFSNFYSKISEKIHKIIERIIEENRIALPHFEPEEFSFLLQSEPAQRDFREFLVSNGVPDLCAYINFSVQAYALRNLDGPIREREIRRLYDAHIRTRAYEKIDMNDFGLDQKKIEEKIKNGNFSSDIFVTAVQQCAHKLRLGETIELGSLSLLCNVRDGK